METPDDQRILNEFGKRLKDIRNSRNMTQLDLAVSTGKDQGQIARYENGEINPTLTTIYRFAQALGTSPDELFPVFK
jgi:transcriptional regulator with XRE-family HTH domain